MRRSNNTPDPSAAEKSEAGRKRLSPNSENHPSLQDLHHAHARRSHLWIAIPFVGHRYESRQTVAAHRCVWSAWLVAVSESGVSADRREVQFPVSRARAVRGRKGSPSTIRGQLAKSDRVQRQTDYSSSSLAIRGRLLESLFGIYFMSFIIHSLR